MCGNSKELSQPDGSFAHPKQMFKLMDKKVFNFMLNFFLSGPIIVKSIYNIYL